MLSDSDLQVIRKYLDASRPPFDRMQAGLDAMGTINDELNRAAVDGVAEFDRTPRDDEPERRAIGERFAARYAALIPRIERIVDEYGSAWSAFEANADVIIDRLPYQPGTSDPWLTAAAEWLDSIAFIAAAGRYAADAFERVVTAVAGASRTIPALQQVGPGLQAQLSRWIDATRELERLGERVERTRRDGPLLSQES